MPDESVGGGVRDFGVDVGAGVGDVGCEEFDGLWKEKVSRRFGKVVRRM